MKTNPLRRRLGMLALLAACLCVPGLPATAGSNLDTFDRTGNVPSPIPGQILATAKGTRLDDRCIPLAFRVNTSIDPIPNGFGLAPLPLAQAIESIQRALDSWNEIPTSYVDMRIVGTLQGSEPPGLDFVNEVTFVFPSELQAVGQSLRVSLMRDSQLSHGEDLDGDGDADVSSAIATCADVDGDGDIEFPAGFYAAGTILDSDVRFNPEVRFTTELDRVDTYNGIWDLQGIAAHEFGHSHGLGHSGIMQRSTTDGSATTMYNAFRDPVDARALRTLYSDDIAWSSFLYPEGSRRHGPGALQKGDIRFEQRYAVIRGEVKDAFNRPLVGAVVFAEDLHGRVVSNTITGHLRVSIDPLTGFTWLLPRSLAFIDGKYELPVPKGVYRIGIEPNDGWPEPTLSDTFAGYYSFFYGAQFFTEEYYSGPLEDETEARLGFGVPVAALHDRHGIDFRLDYNAQHTFNADDSGGFVANGPVLLAYHAPVAEILALDRGRGLLIQAATFGTIPLDSSETPRYEAAMIATGKVAPDGTVSVDVERPLVRQAPFIGQDADLTPLYVEHSWLLGAYVKHVLPALGKDLFVVLAFADDPYPPFPEAARHGILADLATAESPSERSYYSRDGGKTWQRETFSTYSFGLVIAPR